MKEACVVEQPVTGGARKAADASRRPTTTDNFGSGATGAEPTAGTTRALRASGYDGRPA